MTPQVSLTYPYNCAYEFTTLLSVPNMNSQHVQGAVLHNMLTGMP